MWKKWFPWQYIVREVARAQGFIDPMGVLAKLQRFAQPSEVAAPVELLRMTAVLQARGLMNMQAIQHNLDWIWPYWVVRQFDPMDTAFVPRAFSMTHINLTHRNWTAVGLPDFAEFTLVDPRGLVTPLYDGWSLDTWIVVPGGKDLVPSRLENVEQELLLDNELCVRTLSTMEHAQLETWVDAVWIDGLPTCRYRIRARANQNAWCVVSLRPYNPEGVSFIESVEMLSKKEGWCVNDKHKIIFKDPADEYGFSNYRNGDIYHDLGDVDDAPGLKCDVGMITAAATYELKAGQERFIEVRVPLNKESMRPRPKLRWAVSTAGPTWGFNQTPCNVQIPDVQFEFLHRAAEKSMILHSPDEVYPGPFTYRHFWFRDAVIILYSMLTLGFDERVEHVIDGFPKRQHANGHFRSQDGEWDSNGQVLWLIDHFCRLTDSAPKPAWKSAIIKGARWIIKKRVHNKENVFTDGLLPAGFSAEHLGPNDHYYWDDFWSVEGLRGAARLMRRYGESKLGHEFDREADDLMASIERSITHASARLGTKAIPASPYRRMDTGAIGSIVAGYPLQLWPALDSKVLQTADYLYREHFVNGGFFHQMSHSGINAYLSLHIAQVFLRAGDKRYWEIMKAVARFASSTGQWPEAIHPQTGGGCMGDGQHIWASAEWLLMLRSCFLREENDTLVLGPGIPEEWLNSGKDLSYGPTLTVFGAVTVRIKQMNNEIIFEWLGDWTVEAPRIEIRLLGYPVMYPKDGEAQIKIPRK